MLACEIDNVARSGETRTSAMRTGAMEGLAAELARAEDVGGAVRALATAAGSDEGMELALLPFDARRGALLPPLAPGRAKGTPDSAERVDGAAGHSLVSLDHLAPEVRQGVLAGGRFVEVGDQAVEYARLVGLSGVGARGRLFLRGIVLDGGLTAVLAVRDDRGRVSRRTLQRLEPMAILFELAYARLFEREARFEAVAALHDVTSRMRAEHASAVAALEREVARLRGARPEVDPPGVAELRAAADRAARRAAAAEARLAAVEAQVASAVERLERAHLQIHEQSEIIGAQAAMIRELGHEPPASARVSS